MAPTFASAAASGSNSHSSRADGTSDRTRRANGATQTFRRPSQATSTTPIQRESNSHQPRNSTDGASAGVYIPPHLNSTRNGAYTDSRYNKDSLIHVFKGQQESDNISHGLPDLFVSGWAPSTPNGIAAPSWGRREEHKENHSVDLCWDRTARMVPLALQELTEDEKDLFNGTVNSPIKPPTQTNKDATPKDGGSHRKLSISQSINSPGGFGLSSPTQARPGNRRRDTSEAYPFPSPSVASPGGASRYPKDDSTAATPPAALLRRRTERKESISESMEERDKDKDVPLAGLKRSVTAGLGVTGTSTWGTGQGAFGSFAIGANSGQPAATDKRAGYGSVRGQSRFANLMSKELGDDPVGESKDTASSAGFGRQNETDSERNVSSWMEARQNRPTSDDTDPYPDENRPTGSAALGGGLDISPPKQRGFGGADYRDEAAFSAFGMTSDTIAPRGNDDFLHQTPQHGQHRHDPSQEPMSPTNTNPYQSPENEKTHLEEMDADSSDMHPHLPNLAGYRPNPPQGLPGLGTFPGLGRIPAPFEVAASDRSQTSSTGPSRGFPSLSGLGTFPGLGGASPWSAGPQTAGTPTRERVGFGGAFGDGLFSSAADAQSPVLAGLGGMSGFGGVRSKMGSLFPRDMQDQMRHGEPSASAGEEQNFDPFYRQHPPFGAASRTAAIANAGPPRDGESPFRNNSGMFDDLLRQSRGDFPSAIGESTTSGFGLNQPGANHQTPLSSVPSQETIGLGRKSQSNLQRQPSNLASPSSSNPPIAQIRQMVMPDRMKWIYKDPQGSTQGPWSGLEMHDWYKAGFFTPELLIKRVEDPEFEPLAQLIRRIGNSREPFLVPQIGVAHDPPTSGSRASAGAAGVQPPFANSFPSFGTTLTAEQQNALERRKQEEQFLMARQKEHLAQQQVFIKNGMPVPGPHGILGGQLHHHSSAHSLHSQPSFGSVTSPAAYQPSPSQGPSLSGQPVPGFFDTTFRQGQSGPGVSLDMLGNVREDEIPGMLERMNLNRAGQQQAGGQLPLGQGVPGDSHSQQVAAMLQDRARLQREQADHDNRQGPSQEEFGAAAAHDRFHQFQELRAQAEQEANELAEQAEHGDHRFRGEQGLRNVTNLSREEGTNQAETLTQQVQAAASAKQASVQQSPWGKIDTSHVQIDQRPPQSSSPMPAPIAQRKQNVADTLAAESRSQTQSPAVDTPSTSVAPWASQAAEVPKKTQSLKEIQEAEAKRAAKQEELAAAQRRAAYERELAAAQAATIAPAPGLPTGATWASQSPATSTGSAAPVWGPKTTSKPSGKTLQQIQKEEEAKKTRAAIAAAVTTATVIGAPTAGSKRYADLAGKTVLPVAAGPQTASAWTTVGVGGKVKPLVPSPVAPVPGRSVSGTVTTLAGLKPPTARSTTLGSVQTGKLNKPEALELFKQWAMAELQRGQLNPDINAGNLVETLLAFGSEIEIIIEAVHSSSQTIDSRHFAEEFLRRKKQADKGVVEPSTTASPGAAKPNESVWSSVAKKGQQPPADVAQEQPFKMAKAKGRRK